jgi:hypothetical protein
MPERMKPTLLTAALGLVACSDASGSTVPAGPPIPVVPSTPGSTCGGSTAEPNAAKTLDGYLSTLPEPPKGELRPAITDAILRACEVFRPTSNAKFTREHCWAHLAAAAAKESTFTPTLIVEDNYGKRTVEGQKADDPTVGLTQIRFSSAVHDVAVFGKLDGLACIGCTLPQSILEHVKEQGDSLYWAVTGPRQNLATMQSVQCNIGIGAWNYYVPASGNGNPAKPTYSYQYCDGKGTGANLVTGLRSYLNGPNGGNGVLGSMAAIDALQASDNNSYKYVTQIKTWFDAMVSAPTTGSHPFFEGFSPEPTRYCR